MYFLKIDRNVVVTKDVDIGVLNNQTLTKAIKHERDPNADRYDDGDAIIFETAHGVQYRMSHHQDCCESVYIESINGDLTDLVGSPISIAEERVQFTKYDYNTDDKDGDEQWTFYTLATNKGYVDIRWNGTSNGYYSVGVSFEHISLEDEILAWCKETNVVINPVETSYDESVLEFRTIEEMAHFKLKFGGKETSV